MVAVLAVLWAAPALAGADDNATAPRRGLDIDVRHDLRYRHAGGDDLKLDAYIPAGGGVRPGVMVIYGGGWILGSKEQSAPLARALAEQGFIAFAMNYRLAPFHPFPAAVDDVQASVAWVRDHAFDFGLDPGMLATLGEGPHDQGSRVSAAVSWAGPMDLHPEIRARVPDLPRRLPRLHRAPVRRSDHRRHLADLPRRPERRADPARQRHRRHPSCPPDQALRMADALERAGVGHELTIIPGGPRRARRSPGGAAFLQVLAARARRRRARNPGSVGIGGDGGGGLLAPAIVIAVAALAVGALLVVSRRNRRRVRY